MSVNQAAPRSLLVQLIGAVAVCAVVGCGNGEPPFLPDGGGSIAFEDTLPVGGVVRVSIASDGSQGDRGARRPSISADGRFVAFESDATNLVAGDANGTEDLRKGIDIFVHDRQSGLTKRASIASDGTEGNGPSSAPCISADGQYVAFDSYATNLVPGDTNDGSDVFVHDLRARQTTRVSVASDGTPAAGRPGFPFLSGGGTSISAGGRYVAFGSFAENLVSNDSNLRSDVFLHDRQTGMTIRVGEQNSFGPRVSADGKFVAFWTGWSPWSVSVHEVQNAATTLVSVAQGGTPGNGDSWFPSISGSGRYVAFQSKATNLVAGDTNGAADVLVHDFQSGITSRVSVASDGTQADGDSERPSISTDGRFIAFASLATNLVMGDTNDTWDVFVHDRHQGLTTRVSVSSDGTQGDSGSTFPSISADGRYVAFASEATTLVSEDTNNRSDIFVVRLR